MGALEHSLENNSLERIFRKELGNVEAPAPEIETMRVTMRKAFEGSLDNGSLQRALAANANERQRKAEHAYAAQPSDEDVAAMWEGVRTHIHSGLFELVGNGTLEHVLASSPSPDIEDSLDNSSLHHALATNAHATKPSGAASDESVTPMWEGLRTHIQSGLLEMLKNGNLERILSEGPDFFPSSECDILASVLIDDLEQPRVDERISDINKTVGGDVPKLLANSFEVGANPVKLVTGEGHSILDATGPCQGAAAHYGVGNSDAIHTNVCAVPENDVETGCLDVLRNSLVEDPTGTTQSDQKRNDARRELAERGDETGAIPTATCDASILKALGNADRRIGTLNQNIKLVEGLIAEAEAQAAIYKIELAKTRLEGQRLQEKVDKRCRLDDEVGDRIRTLQESQVKLVDGIEELNQRSQHGHLEMSTLQYTCHSDSSVCTMGDIQLNLLLTSSPLRGTH